MRNMQITSFLLGLLCVVWVRAEVAPAEMENNKIIAQQIIQQAWNQGEITMLASVYKPELIKPIENKIKTWREAWGDININIQEQIAQDDKVVTLWEFSGMQDGKWHDIPVSNTKVKFHGMTIQQFAEDYVVSEWDSRDDMRFNPQHGMIIGEMQHDKSAIQPLLTTQKRYHNIAMPKHEFQRFIHNLQRRRFQTAKIDFIDNNVPNYRFTVAQMLASIESGDINFSSDRRHVFQVFYPRLVDLENVELALMNRRFFSASEKRKLDAWINEYQRRR